MNKPHSRKNNERAIIVFDKHKSWYKVDIDGEFITKNIEVEKKTTINKKRVARRPTMQAAEMYPESVVKTHEIIFKMAVHSTVTFLLLLIAYFGFAFFTLGKLGSGAAGLEYSEDAGGHVLEIIMK